MDSAIIDINTITVEECIARLSVYKTVEHPVVSSLEELQDIAHHCCVMAAADVIKTDDLSQEKKLEVLTLFAKYLKVEKEYTITVGMKLRCKADAMEEISGRIFCISDNIKLYFKEGLDLNNAWIYPVIELKGTIINGALVDEQLEEVFEPIKVLLAASYVTGLCKYEKQYIEDGKLRSKNSRSLKSLLFGDADSLGRVGSQLDFEFVDTRVNIRNLMYENIEASIQLQYLSDFAYGLYIDYDDVEKQATKANKTLAEVTTNNFFDFIDNVKLLFLHYPLKSSEKFKEKIKLGLIWFERLLASTGKEKLVHIVTILDILATTTYDKSKKGDNLIIDQTIVRIAECISKTSLDYERAKTVFQYCKILRNSYIHGDSLAQTLEKEKKFWQRLGIDAYTLFHIPAHIKKTSNNLRIYLYFYAEMYLGQYFKFLAKILQAS